MINANSNTGRLIVGYIDKHGVDSILFASVIGRLKR
jgi:hypothetical protein